MFDAIFILNNFDLFNSVNFFAGGFIAQVSQVALWSTLPAVAWFALSD